MKNYEEIRVTIIRETERAIKIEHDQGRFDIWLPKSQIEIDGYEGNKTGMFLSNDFIFPVSLIVTIPEWLAIENELV